MGLRFSWIKLKIVHIGPMFLISIFTQVLTSADKLFNHYYLNHQQNYFAYFYTKITIYQLNFLLAPILNFFSGKYLLVYNKWTRVHSKKGQKSKTIFWEITRNCLSTTKERINLKHMPEKLFYRLSGRCIKSLKGLEPAWTCGRKIICMFGIQPLYHFKNGIWNKP